MIFGGGVQPKFGSCQRLMWVIWAVLGLSLIRCQVQPPPPPVDPILIGGQEAAPPLERPPASFYRIEIIQDGEAWAFYCMVYDTVFQHNFCHDGPGLHHIVLGVAACNEWAECTQTVWSDTFWAYTVATANDTAEGSWSILPGCREEGWRWRPSEDDN